MDLEERKLIKVKSKLERATITLSSGETLEVENFEVECSEEQARMLLTEMPWAFSIGSTMEAEAEAEDRSFIEEE